MGSVSILSCLSDSLEMGGRESLFGEREGELCGEMKKEMAKVFHALANFSFFQYGGFMGVRSDSMGKSMGESARILLA